MVDEWADDPAEFVKRTAFALLASLALHDKKSGDEPFLDRLPLIEAAATDERNFVKKGVSWALRGIGGRKSPVLPRSRARAGRSARRLSRQDGAMDRPGRAKGVRQGGSDQRLPSSRRRPGSQVQKARRVSLRPGLRRGDECGQTRSITVAMPCPTPMHIVQSA